MVGQYNTVSTATDPTLIPTFIVGCGTGEEGAERKNAIEVIK